MQQITGSRYGYVLKWTTTKIIWKGCRGQHQIGWVQNHLYSVLEHCVHLLQLSCSYDWGIKFVLLLMRTHKHTWFSTRNEQQNISSQETTWMYTRTHCVHTVSWHNSGCANLPYILPYIFSCAGNQDKFTLPSWVENEQHIHLQVQSTTLLVVGTNITLK